VVLRLLESQATRERGAARLFAQALPLCPPSSRWRGLVAFHAREEEAHYGLVAAVWSEASARPRADLDAQVEARLAARPLPAVSTFAALAVAEFLFDRAGGWQLREYLESSFAPYRALARAILDDERGHEEAGARMLVEIAGQGGAPRAEAQAALPAWLREALLSFGRPGSEGNRHAIAAGLKRRDSAEVMRDFMADVAPGARAAGLTVPPLASLGLDLPGPAAAGR
jgi:1,2-phenylacetyl-CoA epoxidase catalytic subunit